MYTGPNPDNNPNTNIVWWPCEDKGLAYRGFRTPVTGWDVTIYASRPDINEEQASSETPQIEQDVDANKMCPGIKDCFQVTAKVNYVDEHKTMLWIHPDGAGPTLVKVIGTSTFIDTNWAHGKYPEVGSVVTVVICLDGNRTSKMQYWEYLCSVEIIE